MENVCDVSVETHFFAAILRVKTDHAEISPTCEWDPIKIHGWLFHNHEQAGVGERRLKAA
jgi:hypothetical protein